MVANHKLLPAPRRAARGRQGARPPRRRDPGGTRRIPWFSDDDSLEATLAHHPNFAELDLPPGWRDLAREAQPLVGVPRHLSLHPGGVVIVPTALTDYVPTQPAQGAGKAPRTWRSGHPVREGRREDAGWVKIDLLGNRSLAVIRTGIAMWRAHRGAARLHLIGGGGRIRPPGRCSARPDLASLHRVARSRLLCRKSQAGQLRAAGLNTSIIRPASTATSGPTWSGSTGAVPAARSVPPGHAGGDLRRDGVPGGRGQF